MKRFLSAMTLGVLVLSGGLQATAATNHLTIDAVSFNYISGTPDYTESVGLVAGGSSGADGFANVALPQGAVVSQFKVCGRDDANDANFVGKLWRKNTNPVNSAFTPPQLMATVASSLADGSDAMQCLKTTAITAATIDDTKWTYFVELQPGSFVEVISVTINY